MPSGHDEDVEIDYALDDEDEANIWLDEMDLSNYDDAEKQINEPEMTPQRIKKYINKKIKDGKFRRNQLKGAKDQITTSYKKGQIDKEHGTY